MLKRPLVRKPIGHPLGVNPAGVLLFRNRALGDVSAAESTVLLRAVTSNNPRPKLPLPPPSIHSLLLAGSKVLKRPPVRSPIGHPLGLNPAGVLLFRNRALGGASAAEPLPQRPVLLRAQRCYETAPIHPLFAFSWFEGAETAPGPQTNWPPLGRESCWGSAVSEPCPIRDVSAAESTVLLQAVTSNDPRPKLPLPPPSVHSLLLAGSKVLKRPLVRSPIGHPLGVNPAGVLLFRNRAL